jgi:hypothetical protein
MTPAPTTMTSRVLTSVSRSPFRRHADAACRCRQSHLAAVAGMSPCCLKTGRGGSVREFCFAIFSLFKIPEKHYFLAKQLLRLAKVSFSCTGLGDCGDRTFSVKYGTVPVLSRFNILNFGLKFSKELKVLNA